MWGRVALLTVIAAGCAPSAPTNEAVAGEIERQVQAAYPGLPLDRYARFYARLDNGTVEGVFSYAGEEGYEISGSRAGEVLWTNRDDLPIIHDGGCTVISITFDARAKELIHAYCNTDA
jgi:hypothetical protein